MRKILVKSLWLIVFLAGCLSLGAQQYDLLIKNAHLIDAKNNLDEPMDVAVLDGKIAEVAKQIPGDKAEKVVDASGMYVVPGLIDMHVHLIFHRFSKHNNFL